MEEADPTRFKAVIYNGQPLLLQLSPDNAFGFLDICHQNDRKRTKPFYAKFTPGRPEETGAAAAIQLGDGRGGGV